MWVNIFNKNVIAGVNALVIHNYAVNVDALMVISSQ